MHHLRMFFFCVALWLLSYYVMFIDAFLCTHLAREKMKRRKPLTQPQQQQHRQKQYSHRLQQQQDLFL